MELEVLNKLNEIFSDLFDMEDIVISRDTTASDVNGWDSLMHITLVSEVEDVFNIKFTMKQILEMQNVGEMIDLIIEKGGRCE